MRAVPPRASVLLFVSLDFYLMLGCALRSVLSGRRRLKLHAIDAIAAVNEQYEDEYECDLVHISDLRSNGVAW